MSIEARELGVEVGDLVLLALPHEVLLLDEPERALDDVGREWLGDLIQKDTAVGVPVVIILSLPVIVF